VARPTYNLHQHLTSWTEEPSDGKLFCVNQQHASIHQPTTYTDIHNSTHVASLGLEQQHEELCSNTPRGNQKNTKQRNNEAVKDHTRSVCTLRKPLYHSCISSSLNCVLARRSSNCSGFSLLFCFPIGSTNNYLL